MDRFGKFQWVLIGLLLAVVLTPFLLIADPEEQTPQTSPTAPTISQLTVNSIEEQGSDIVVSTNYCLLKYPYAFSDLIQPEAVNDGNAPALVFRARINAQTYKLYSLTFGGQGNMLVGYLTLEDGQEPIKVYATIFELASQLSDDARIAFIAAQETFNDVMVSLQENENFVLAAEYGQDG